MRSLLVLVALLAASGQVIIRRVPPTLLSLSPSSGAVGASVVITGTDFGTNQENTTVSVNGVIATATAWSATSATITIPTTTTGSVTMTRGGLTSNALTFTVTASGLTCDRTATSLSQANVDSMVKALTAGQTGCLPAGTASWTSQITWNAPANVRVIGAGSLTTTGGGDVTNIVDDYASEAPLWVISTNASGTFRLAGITFKGGTGLVKDSAGMVQIAGQSKLFRMDHMHFNQLTYSPANNGADVRFTEYVTGVIDHSIFDQNGIGNAIQVHYDSYGGGIEGNAAWAAATGFGTSDFLFTEDSIFNGADKFGTANDCEHGGKWVMRHNAFNRTQMQTHPTGGSGPDARGCRAMEAYSNTFLGNNGSGLTGANFNVMYLSAGGMLIYNNTAARGYENFMTLHSVRRYGKSDPRGTYDEIATPGGWGYCGTSFNGTGSNWDGNTDTTTGYPCLDQPGQGVGDLLTGEVPSKTNAALGGITWPRQALEPVYEWLNTPYACSGCDHQTFWSVDEPTVLAANRDYYLYSASFTGATGTGAGLLASRPLTCTTGVAYWATNTSTLYKCTSTNTWTTYYTPYTYPHPLNH